MGNITLKGWECHPGTHRSTLESLKAEPPNITYDMTWSDVHNLAPLEHILTKQIKDASTEHNSNCIGNTVLGLFIWF